MEIKLISSIAAIDPQQWKALESPHYPFNDYAFLKALEDTGSISGESGWRVLYLTLQDEAGLWAAHPAYIKTHSYGEYIFDWDWARFYAQYQVPYYPKLLSALPLTPATGPRLLVRPGAPASAAEVLVRAALGLAQKSAMSSYHALFLEAEELPLYVAEGCMLRHSLQYHWQNQNYRDFADYLDTFISKRRRDIQRERRKVQEQGLQIEKLSGTDLTPELASVMDDLYRTTTDKKEAIAYLQPGFFQSVFASMGSEILLVLARDKGQPVAAALNFFKGEKLYGRYWGAFDHYPDLHFELCYYQTLDFAIEKGLRMFEAGAQGHHKIQRGFLPTLTYSAHQIFDPRFRAPIENFVREEKEHIAAAMRELQSQNPFRPLKTASGSSIESPPQ